MHVLPHVCFCNTCVPGAHGGQEKVFVLLGLELQVIVSFVWVLRELSPDSLEEQPALLTTDPWSEVEHNKNTVGKGAKGQTR